MTAGAVTVVGAIAAGTASVETGVGPVAAAFIAAHAANTAISGWNDFTSATGLFGGKEDNFGQVNILKKYFYDPIVTKVVGDNKTVKDIVYLTADFATTMTGISEAVKAMTAASKAATTSVLVSTGDWVNGYRESVQTFKIATPNWGKAIAAGSVVVRDGIIYVVNAKGEWSQVKTKQKETEKKKTEQDETTQTTTTNNNTKPATPPTPTTNSGSSHSGSSPSTNPTDIGSSGDYSKWSYACD